MAFNPLDLIKAANKKIEEGAKTVVTDLKKGKEATTYKTLQNLVNVAKKQDEVKAQQAVRQAQIDESLRKAGVKPSTISAVPTAPLDTLLTRTAQNAQSYPELTGYLPQKRDNVADLDTVSNIISGIYNTVKKPIISGASNILGMSNPLLKYTGVGKKLQNMAEGALKETVENPAQTLKDRLSAIYQKQDERQSTNIGDRANDTLAMGTALTGTVLSGLPVSAGYNAIVGALRGNKETENIANIADVTTQALPSFIADQVNKIEGVSPEAKDALSMLANVGLVGLGSKVGKGVQKRIDSPAYTSSFSNAFADAIKQNRNVFASGLNIDPIIKAAVAGEKALVKNPIVQALDPTGITSGASNVIDAQKPVIDTNKQKIKDTLQSRIDDFVTKITGYDTSKYDTYTPKVGAFGKTVDVINAPVNALSNLLRKGEQKVGTALEKGLSSKQPVIRYASATMQNLFRDMAKSPELEAQTNKFRGALNTANQHPADVMDSIYKIIDNSAASKSRIFDLLDQELARDKNIKYDDLSPKEKVAYNMIKEGNDLIHDISYSMGKISPELYEKNKGKYSARTYTTFELPEEMQKAVNESTKKMIDSVYKQRGKVDNWKIENALRDPVYNLGKRMSQVFQSKAVDDYANYLAKNSNVVSDVERPGFVKLEGKGYGTLEGKYVQKQIAEEFKGFFYTNEVLNKAYDVFKAYDKMGIRQAQKKALTMYNPATNINNITSDVVFSFLAGVDPLSLHKNVAKVLSNKKEMKEISNYLMKQGASGADMVRSEFYKKVGDVEGVRDKNTPKTSLLDKVISKGKKIDETVSGIYSGTDDVYKAAAFKTLVEYGNTPERAAQLVRDGFQNYNKVGKLFDVYSKTPVIGSAFTKFTGNLMSIIKSGMVNRPLNTIGFVYALKMIGDMTSKWSGETEEERKLREERLGAPQISIPGVGNIPLAWNTPYGEVNIARMIAPAFTNVELDKKQATIGDYAEKFLPFGNILSGDVGQLPQDPLLGPIARLYMDKDFRGKNISDPNQSKYNPSTATESEKLMNKLRFLQRSYTPPVGNTAEDTIQNLLGNQDYYGKERTPTQALLRTLGIKVEQFGKEQVQKQIDMQKKSDEFKVTDTKKAITDIFNEYTDKKINLSTEKKDARLRALQEENPTFDVFSYYKEIEAKKLNEKSPKPKTASQQLSAIKAEKRAEKLTEQKQVQANKNIEEIKNIVKSTTSIDEARKQIKNKYKTLSDEAIEKLIIYSLK